MKQIECDVAIIGAGTAGMTAYASAKRAGKRVVLIENGPYGTMCARVGCMPSKLLIAAAEAAHALKLAPVFGLPSAVQQTIDGAAVMQRLKAERDDFVSSVLHEVEQYDSDDKLQGKARFLGDHRLQVDEHTQVHAAHIIVATGSVPVRPPSLEALGDRLITNEDVFSLDHLPRRILVVGTGAIGLELGQALSRLGVQVRIVGRGDNLAGIQDEEIRSLARAVFESELDLRFGVDILSSVVRDGQAWVTLSADGEQIEEAYDYVLAAAGRRPALQDLAWEHTSAKLDDRGVPVYDALTLQVGNTPIFLVGDASGGRALQHEAADEGRIAARQAVAGFASSDMAQRRAPLAIVFSDPQIAQVGQTYKHLPDGVLCGRMDFKRQGRARVIARNEGLIKLYADHGGNFLGAELLGPQAEHLAHLLAWACQQKMTVTQMLAMPFYHPVLEEGIRTALRDLQQQLRAL